MPMQNEDNRHKNNASLLTIREVAQDGKVSEKSVRRWISQGTLPAVRFGRALRIETIEWQRFIATRRT